MRLLLVIPLVLLLGCRDYTRDAADAHAGALVIRSNAATMTPEQLRAVAVGLANYVLAITSKLTLPPPSMTPDEILADPEDYADAGVEAQAEPLPPVPLPGSKEPEPGLLDRLKDTGFTLFDSGIWIGAIGLAIVAIFAFTSWIKWMPVGFLGTAWRILSAILPVPARLAALWGGGSAAVGAAVVWLAAWWWAVVLVVLAVTGVIIWDHWKIITKWWRKRHVLPR